MTLHDTRTGQIRELVPETPPRVRIYACGPTVYGRVHVGNARPFVVFSLLKRFLVHEGYDVEFVANVTDINDKIYVAARQAGIPSEVLAEQMTAAYRADTDVFGLGRPDHEPLASETIAEIIGLIKELMEGGHAYAADGDVYFAVRSYPQYGELSHRQIDLMDQGEGVEGAARKRDPLDFALWKGHKEAEDTSWESPWGPGRPGWHIECSAMAEELLGVGFEIHGGGSDLIFPHHENEAAQTRAARDQDLAPALDARRDGAPGRREDVQVDRQRVHAGRGAGAPRARDAAHVLRRRPLPPAHGVRRGPPRGGPRPCGRDPQHGPRARSTVPARTGRRR